MKVLHLSNTPLSNAPHNLMTCQNFVLGEGTADLLVHRLQNTNKTYVGLGTAWPELSRYEISSRLKDADILHFHNFAKEQMLFKQFPEFWDLIKNKPKLIQYHSPRHSIESFEESINDKTMKHAVIAQYHVRQYPECEFIVPNVVPIFLPQYQGVATKWNQTGMSPTVSYAPSNISLREWDDKGYQLTKDIMRELQNANLCNAEIMVGVPYLDCMKKKRWAHIGIDEVITGSYHLSSLEYLSMGCVTIGYLDAQTQAAIASVAGPEAVAELPWVQARPETLKSVLAELLHNRGELKEKAHAGRAWMEKHWHPEQHVMRFKKIYESL